MNEAQVFEILSFAAVLLVSVVLHEVIHGFIAYIQGDPTAKRAGRLTLNPLKHIDPFRTLLLPALLWISTGGRFFFGMAKPVPVNFSLLKNRKAGMISVALAGPAMNLALAVLSAKLWNVTGQELFILAAYLNLGLALFNLIPVPPLDGSRILAGLMPESWAYPFFKVEKFGYIVILILYFTGVLERVLMPALIVSGRLLGLPNIEGVV